MPEPAAPSPSDDELLQQSGRGDRAAFAELYRRLSPRLYGYLKTMLFDDRDRQDVLQEVFVHLWQRGADYQPGKSAAFTWAALIMRHKAIDRLRKGQRRDKLTDRLEEEPEVEKSIPMPSDNASSKEQHQIILNALESLDLENREPIELAYFKGYTQQEIATALGQPLGTVKARIRRGLFKLRQNLLHKT